jgi:hypothetical protein
MAGYDPTGKSVTLSCVSSCLKLQFLDSRTTARLPVHDDINILFIQFGPGV